MDAGKVFVLVLSAFAIGILAYLHWMSVREERKSTPEIAESDPTPETHEKEQGKARRASARRRRRPLSPRTVRMDIEKGALD